MRYRFIQQYPQQYPQQFPVVAMCRTLRVSTSGYYGWLGRPSALLGVTLSLSKGRPQSPRQQAHRRLVAQIKAVHARSRRSYGRRRIHAQLGAQGIPCSRNRVARLMRQNGIRAVGRRRCRATTDSKHSFPPAPNRLERDFTATAPNQVWVSDITYLPSEEGWLYLATVMDLYSRRIVGWAMEPTLQRRLTLGALEMAISQRRPGPGLIHHSDRGSQYACGDYQAALQGHGMIPSMSRKGDCWDNASMESFYGTLKCELTHRWKHQPREQARREVFEYLEVFYNRQRLHSSLGYQAPAAFEVSAARTT